MTAVLISNSLINKLKPKQNAYDVRDSRLKGFLIRVYPTGNMTYFAQYTRGKRVGLGKVGVLTPVEAREKAVKVLADFTDGVTPHQARKRDQKVPTLRQFIEGDYAAWVKTHNVSGVDGLKNIRRHFSDLLDMSLNEIKAQDLEKWRTKKLESNTMKKNTINRTITPLRSALNKAVEWEVIEQHGLNDLKSMKYDDARLRYLSKEERQRLFAGLEAREALLKKQRRSANEWRQDRGYHLYPDRPDEAFVDHLMPMIIVSLNTGTRQGELLALKRSHINLEQGTLFVEKSKNYLARHIPLNKKASNALRIWLAQTKKLNSEYLFPSPHNSSKPISTINSAWRTLIRAKAKIDNFRWHDLRHDFASNLVMKGVSLYAVQKLMGHKRIDQTMKYAHLAPEYIAESVGRLDVEE